MLASIIAVSPLAIDMYLPAMLAIAAQLDADITQVQNSLSIYLFGYAIGLIIFGPMADKRSRRKMVFIGLSGFVVASFLLPFSQTIEQFQAVRFVQAFISSAATVVVPGTIRELYGKNTAKGLSYVSMIMMVAPMIAPAIGSGLLLWLDWQSIFWSLGIYALIILAFAVIYLPESQRDKSSSMLSFIQRYKLVFCHKAARFDLLTSMIISLAFFAYITAIPFVYLTVFGVSELNFSFLFAIAVFGLMTSHFINTRLVVKKGSRKMLYIGLSVALVSSILLAFANFLALPLVYTVITVLPLMGSISMIAVNADALVLLRFGESSGTATAVIGTLRFGIGSLAGPILAYFYTGDALPFALLMAVSVIIVAICQGIRIVKHSDEAEPV